MPAPRTALFKEGTYGSLFNPTATALVAIDLQEANMSHPDESHTPQDVLDRSLRLGQARMDELLKLSLIRQYWGSSLSPESGLNFAVSKQTCKGVILCT